MPSRFSRIRLFSDPLDCSQTGTDLRLSSLGPPGPTPSPGRRAVSLGLKQGRWAREMTPPRAASAQGARVEILCRRSRDKLGVPGRACLSGAGIPGPWVTARPRPRCPPSNRRSLGHGSSALHSGSAQPRERSLVPSASIGADQPRPPFRLSRFGGSD